MMGASLPGSPFAWILTAAMALLACERSKSTGTQPTDEEYATQRLTEAKSLDEALVAIRHLRSTVTAGGYLASWATKHLELGELVERRGSHEYSKLLEDGDEARGKAVCGRFLVDVIETVPTDLGTMFVGDMRAGTDEYTFNAVRDARGANAGAELAFCGVVVGREAGPNAQRVRLVGAFMVGDNLAQLSPGQRAVIDRLNATK